MCELKCQNPPLRSLDMPLPLSRRRVAATPHCPHKCASARHAEASAFTFLSPGGRPPSSDQNRQRVSGDLCKPTALLPTLSSSEQQWAHHNLILSPDIMRLIWQRFGSGGPFSVQREHPLQVVVLSQPLRIFPRG